MVVSLSCFSLRKRSATEIEFPRLLIILETHVSI